jgi:hypothetical protein
MLVIEDGNTGFGIPVEFREQRRAGGYGSADVVVRCVFRTAWLQPAKNSLTRSIQPLARGL